MVGPHGSGDASDSDSFIVPPKVDMNAPPAYDSIADSALPTYEEVERQKLIEVQSGGDRVSSRRKIVVKQRTVEQIWGCGYEQEGISSELGGC